MEGLEHVQRWEWSWGRVWRTSEGQLRDLRGLSLEERRLRGELALSKSLTGEGSQEGWGSAPKGKDERKWPRGNLWGGWWGNSHPPCLDRGGGGEGWGTTWGHGGGDAGLGTRERARERAREAKAPLSAGAGLARGEPAAGPHSPEGLALTPGEY